jgi:tungstate transport system permease protein
MSFLAQGISDAFALILSMDRSLVEIILLSLRITGSSVFFSTLIGVPLGSLVALKRFPGRRFFINIFYTFMGFPPVVAGLIVYLILSRRGPLGVMGLLYTPTAMIIAQTLLVTPIVAALTHAAVKSVDPMIRDAAVCLGARGLSVGLTVLREARYAIMAAIIAGFGRAIGEVGAVMIVGGNIQGTTRVMTTAIVLETGKGNFELALALGILLLVLAFVVNMGLHYLQART